MGLIAFILGVSLTVGTAVVFVDVWTNPENVRERKEKKAKKLVNQTERAFWLY